MSSTDPSETTALLPSTLEEGHGSQKKPDASEDQPAKASLPGKPNSPAKTSVVHFKTLLVLFYPPSHTPFSKADPIRTSLQLVERDYGDANDFWNIHVDLVLRPTVSADPLTLSVDNLLAVRQLRSTTPASVDLYKGAAERFGTIAFPNGPGACHDFIIALRNHLTFRHLPDAHRPGTLYALEPKPRMRRVAPSLMPTAYPQPDQADQPTGDDFSSLLSDLNISPATSRNSAHRPRPQRSESPPPFHLLTMGLLTQFAKVTQVARDVGESIITSLNEDRERNQRRQAIQRARSHALDIHAQIVASTQDEAALPPRLLLDRPRGIPMSEKAWNALLSPEGYILEPLVVRYAIFAGGISAELRPTLWPFILGFYSWSSTSAERLRTLQQARTEYAVLKRKCVALRNPEGGNIPEEQKQAIPADNMDKVHGRRVEDQIAKDVVRTDRNLEPFVADDSPALSLMDTLLNVYSSYNTNIGYCQGMSDFLAPLIKVLDVDDEALVFWCFEKLMQRTQANFRVDQSGIRSQLEKLQQLIKVADPELSEYFEKTDPDFYSTFRWVLVRFKRELLFEDTIKFWEILWVQHLGGDEFHLFVACALLQAHRTRLLSLPVGAFDALLRYINDMSMRIDVDFALREGDICFRKYGEQLAPAS